MPIVNPEQFLQIALNRFAERFKAIHDFFEIARVPKCERWFTTETIAALLQAGDAPFPAYRIYGEESYSNILRNYLGETEETITGKTQADDLNKRPDVTIMDVNRRRAELVAEAKVVYDAKDSALSDSDGQLIDQLERAVRLCPEATVVGIVFVIYSPQSFKEDSPFTQAIDLFIEYLNALREKEAIVGFRASVKSLDIRNENIKEEWVRLRKSVTHELDHIEGAFQAISVGAVGAHQDATDPEVPNYTYGPDPGRLFDGVTELLKAQSAGRWTLVGDKIHVVPGVEKVGPNKDEEGTASLGIGVLYQNH